MLVGHDGQPARFDPVNGQHFSSGIGNEKTCRICSEIAIGVDDQWCANGPLHVEPVRGELELAALEGRSCT